MLDRIATDEVEQRAEEACDTNTQHRSIKYPLMPLDNGDSQQKDSYRSFARCDADYAKSVVDQHHRNSDALEPQANVCPIISDLVASANCSSRSSDECLPNPCNAAILTMAVYSIRST